MVPCVTIPCVMSRSKFSPSDLENSWSFFFWPAVQDRWGFSGLPFDEFLVKLWKADLWSFPARWTRDPTRLVVEGGQLDSSGWSRSSLLPTELFLQGSLNARLRTVRVHRFGFQPAPCQTLEVGPSELFSGMNLEDRSACGWRSPARLARLSQSTYGAFFQCCSKVLRTSGTSSWSSSEGPKVSKTYSKGLYAPRWPLKV